MQSAPHTRSAGQHKPQGARHGARAVYVVKFDGLARAATR